MVSLSPEQHIAKFLDAWQDSTVRIAEMMRVRDTSFLRDYVYLQELRAANMVSKKGDKHLDEAASALLLRESLSAKLSHSTARKSLLIGLSAHLPKASRTRRLSEHAIVRKAEACLRSHKRDDGIYVFPVDFASRATTTDFRIGTARILSKSLFDAEMIDAWNHFHSIGDRNIDDSIAKYWHEHSGAYDHVITVDITGYEEEMAWPAARDAADTMLNIVRMFFNYNAMDNVRIGDGLALPRQRSTLRLTSDRDICLSTSFGGGGSHLQDGWERVFSEELRGFAPLLSLAVSINVQNDGRPNPTLERLTYFNRLIAEAYCEPHHPIRLVRLVAALEAISMIGSKDKAHSLAHRCGSIGGWSNPRHYCEIYDAVRTAYHWRSSVVHGDAPRENEVLRAFYGLEKHLLGIYLGMLWMHTDIAQINTSRSIRTLRREFERRTDIFFWSPSLAT